MQIDTDNSGFINISELGDALATVGLKLPAYEVRDLIRHSDTKIRDDCLDFEEFKVVSEKKQNCISAVTSRLPSLAVGSCVLFDM